MTKNKKTSSAIFADEHRKIFGEKVKLRKFSAESEISFGNRGEIWNRGQMHHCLRGDGRPWLVITHSPQSVFPERGRTLTFWPRILDVAHC